MKRSAKNLFPVIAGILLVVVMVLGAGAIDAVKRGGGFLFVPSFTPTATNTAVPSDTPTLTPSATMTMTMTATQTATLTPTNTPTDTVTPSPVPTDTPVPTETATLIPTADETAIAEKIYSELTASAEAYDHSQTPSPTPLIPDSELYTGLRKANPADGKELFFVETVNGIKRKGFWMDWNEVSNQEYAACVGAGYCSLPASRIISGHDYFSDEIYRDFPVVNVTREQAADYCSWAGMRLMSLRNWEDASAVIFDPDFNIDRRYDGPEAVAPGRSDIFGNVWEWTADFTRNGKAIIAGGSWKTALQDIRSHRTGETAPDSYAEDIGFRCVSYVTVK